MTLEEAIKRTLRENSRQIATRFEVPLARADYLESLLWSDRSTHAVTEDKPSRRLKLADRQQAAIEATRTQGLVEAQYQDAVRNQIDAVYKAFVDVEEMQEQLHRASINVAKWDQLLKASQALVENRTKHAADLERIKTRYDTARSTHDDAKSSLRRAKTDLGSLLNLPLNERESLEVESRLQRFRSAELP